MISRRADAATSTLRDFFDLMFICAESHSFALKFNEYLMFLYQNVTNLAKKQHLCKLQKKEIYPNENS